LATYEVNFADLGGYRQRLFLVLDEVVQTQEELTKNVKIKDGVVNFTHESYSD